MGPPLSRFNVEVTEKDIARAKRNDSYVCIVSQAIARTIPDATRIETDSQSIRFTVDDARYIYLTPYAVQGYVIGFDAGDEIEPFSFQLRNPQRVARKQRTPSGKAADRAYRKARDAAEKQAADTGRTDIGSEADPSQPEPKPKPKPKPKATATTADPRKAYADAAKAATEPLTKSDKGGRKPPPRVFKAKQRSYGHRLMRINQQETA